MVVEAISNKNFTGTVYTRSNWISAFEKFPTVKQLPELPYNGTERWDEPFHWGSGSYAILIAALQNNHINLIGFDLIGNNFKVNNIYKDTPNYATADSHSVDPNYWIYQTSQVFKSFPDKYFTVFNNDDWQLPDSWKLANVEFKNLDILMPLL